MGQLRHRGRAVVVFLACALLAASCGARLSADERAEAVGATGTGTGGGVATGARTGGATTGGASTGGTSTGASGGGSTAGAATGGAATGGAATGGGDAGAGTGDAGGSTGGSTGGGACAAAAGSTDPGVSDSEIKLGNVSTISGPIPGFGQTGVDGVKAYFNYRNSQGGVCGRQLALVGSDDRLDAGANRSETERLMGEVFGFVGGTTVVDDGGAAVLQGTNVFDCSLAIGAAKNQLPNQFSPNPIDVAANTNGTVGIWNWFKANMGITKVAVVYPAQADARARALAYVADVGVAGLASSSYEVSITETNYAGVASRIESEGNDAVITTLEINGMSRLAQALKGKNIKVPFWGAQAYGPQFLAQAGDAAEGTTLALTYAIFEDAGANPAVATFLDWFRRTSPGTEPDFFSVMSWAAADLCVDAIEAAGATPTRDGVLQALQATTAFNADGLLATRNPAAKQIGAEFMVTKVEGGQWVRVYPASGFGT